FFFIIPLPPTSTLFPSTTLFRSLRTPISIVLSELELARMQTEEGSELARALDSSLEEVGRLDRLAVNLLVLARFRSAGPPPPEPDRKSTRLNSSHVSISYAVFCL